MEKLTLKERVAQLEVKIESLTLSIKNHSSAHVIDRIIQAITLAGMILVIFLLKIVVF